MTFSLLLHTLMYITLENSSLWKDRHWNACWWYIKKGKELKKKENWNDWIGVYNDKREAEGGKRQKIMENLSCSKQGENLTALKADESAIGRVLHVTVRAWPVLSLQAQVQLPVLSWFFDKRNLFEKPYQALELFEERQEAALVHMPTSSLGCLQLSCVVSIWALLQWQPCLCLYRHPIDLDPDHHLQTWFCRFALGPVSSQGPCLAICTLGWPWALSPGLPYTLVPILRGAPLAF